jgi:hypothetical protein
VFPRQGLLANRIIFLDIPQIQELLQSKNVENAFWGQAVIVLASQQRNSESEEGKIGWCVGPFIIE